MWCKFQLIALSLLFFKIEPGNCKEGDVRLVNGTVINEGRIEVCVNGIWGSACELGSYDSIVICKQLGHYNG